MKRNFVVCWLAAFLFANVANAALTNGEKQGLKILIGNQGLYDTVANSVDKIDSVTASATELNYLDITAPGTLDASKAVVVDASKQIDEWDVKTTFQLANVTVTSSAAELNLIDGSVAGTAVASKAAVLGANKNLDVLVLADGGLYLGSGAGTSVSSTAAELNLLDGSVAGTAVASKAAVLGANKNLDTLVLADGGLYLGAGAGTSVSSTAAELNLLDGSVAGTAVASKAAVLGANKNLDVLVVADGGLYLGAGAGTSVSSTAAELNILDGVTADKDEINLLDGTLAGTAVASKVMTLGASKNVDTLVIADGGLYLGAGAGTSVSSTAAELNFLDGSTAGTAVASKAAVLGANKNLDVLVVADGGLYLGAGAGTSVSSTAAELNFLDGSTAGTAVASKAAVLGANKNLDVLVIADGGLYLGAGAGTSVSSTAAELNILDGVTADKDEINLLDGSLAGTAVASKAMVLGASKNVDTLVLADGGLYLGAGAGTSVSSTAAELNLLDGSVAGTAVASKAAVLGANKELDEFHTATLYLGAAAGTAITATAAEINVLASGIARSELNEESGAIYGLPFETWKNDSDGAPVYGFGHAGVAATDFAIVEGGFGVGGEIVQGEGANNTTVTSTAFTTFWLPPEYVEDHDVILHCKARYQGAGTPGTKTIDVAVYEVDTDGAVIGGDICATAAQTDTSSWADYSFTITDTDLTAGNRLQIYIQTVMQETATGGAMSQQIGACWLALDIQG